MIITAGTYVRTKNLIKGEVKEINGNNIIISYIERQTGHKQTMEVDKNDVSIEGFQNKSQIKAMKKPELIEALIMAQNQLLKHEENDDIENVFIHYYPQNVSNEMRSLIANFVSQLSYKIMDGAYGRKQIGSSFGDNGKTYLIPSGIADNFNKILKRFHEEKNQAYKRGLDKGRNLLTQLNSGMINEIEFNKE